MLLYSGYWDCDHQSIGLSCSVKRKGLKSPERTVLVFLREQKKVLKIQKLNLQLGNFLNSSLF